MEHSPCTVLVAFVPDWMPTPTKKCVTLQPTVIQILIPNVSESWAPSHPSVLTSSLLVFLGSSRSNTKPYVYVDVTQVIPMPPKKSSRPKPRRRIVKKSPKATHQKLRSKCGTRRRAKKSYQGVIMQTVGGEKWKGKSRQKRQGYMRI